MSEVRAFAEAFFSHFGARTFPLEDELVVDLPPELATVFGKPRLYLVFAGDGAARPLSPAEDLVVYGSRVLDQMLALLEGRGEIAHGRLPARFALDASRDPPLPLHHCRLSECESHRADARFYIVNFRATFLSDEKREEFITIVLDDAGRPCPDRAEALLQGADLVSPDQPLSLAPAALRSILDLAGALASQHAAARAADVQAAGHARLQKALLRLVTFYRRLAEEVNLDDAEQVQMVRADLERDLARKIADELERHRLRVRLAPLSYAIALAPMAHYRLTLATPHSRLSLELQRDLYTGQVAPLLCHHCHEPVHSLAVCDKGHHLAHPGCLGACQSCQRDVCQRCGIQACALCDTRVCADCIAVCAGCDRWLCAQHVHECAVCGEPVCDACTATCSSCGLGQCRAHLAPCLACGLPTCEEDRWPCHICGRESCPAHASLCPVCGQPHCGDHSFRCVICNQTACARCGRDNQCDTCRQLPAGPILPATAVPGVRGIRPGLYRWQRVQNRQFVVYQGRRWLGQAVIVTDLAGQPVYQHKSGRLPELVAWLKSKPA